MVKEAGEKEPIHGWSSPYWAHWVYNPLTHREIFIPLPLAIKLLREAVEREDLEVALTLAWGLVKSEIDRRAVSIVHSIVSFTKDGLIRPEDFDIFGEYKKVVRKVRGNGKIV